MTMPVVVDVSDADRGVTITTRPAEPGQRGGRRLKARMSMPEAARLLRERHGIAIPESLHHPKRREKHQPPRWLV